MKINSSLNDSIFRDGIEENSHLNPFQAALIIAISYISLLSLYIFISGKIAESISTSVIGLATIELSKGIVYAFTTGIILFAATFLNFRRIARKDNLLIRQNKDILSKEPIVMTGILAASVCHDINNLMTIVIGSTEILKQSKSNDSADLASIKRISDASIKLTDLVGGMMNYGKNYIPGERKNINLSDIINGTISFAKVHKKIKKCAIRYDIQPSIFININSILLERMLMNLMLNAAEATGPYGKMLIKLSLDQGFVNLEVHDNGPGIPADLQEKIFEPFYTSKIGGSGLGLLSIKICAAHHGGIIHLIESDLGGACFCLTFPVNHDASSNHFKLDGL
jgi:signal transduction histidine kinase